MNSPQQSEGMSMVVKTVCVWVKGFILLYGIYIILYGHLTPGGGFAGGVIAAAAFVLIMLAEGSAAVTNSFGRKAASTWVSVGVLLFWLVATLNFVLAGTHFLNFWATLESAGLTLFSSGIIPPSELGIGLMVCSSLFLVVLMLTALIPRQEQEDAP